MGIPYLTKFLKTRCSKKSIYTIPLSKLFGKRIAVDTSIYMYKYERENMLIRKFYQMISTFRYYKITPIFVFDGIPPMEKKDLLDKRRLAKYNNQLKYDNMQLDHDINSHEMKQLKKKLVYITKDKIHKVKELFTAYGMTWIDAPNEADELCASLVHQNKAWGCLSDDNDMFAYGCTNILRNLNLNNHTLTLYNLPNMLDEMNMTNQTFKNKCISMGTDYVCDDAQKMFDLSAYPPINIEIRNGLILKDKLKIILDLC